ncbi:MAG: Hpt domain-containing protein [Aquabacterium sp.]
MNLDPDSTAPDVRSTAAPAIDAEALARLDELDPGGRNGLLPRVLTTYLGSQQRLLAQLRLGRDQQDLAAVHRVAHTLKSSSASIGALELSRLCADVESRIREKALDGLSVQLDRLLAESQRVADAVRAMLGHG